MDQGLDTDRIGGFKILKRLATGGTADVLLAREEGPHGFERVVVLKRLLSQFQRDESFARMFAREASAYARLSHPSIVRLYDFFEIEGELVMVLEFVDGLPLHTLIALLRGSDIVLDDRAAIYIGTRIFGALAAAHEARDLETDERTPMIHRDVNPSNVLIPWDGRAKLADFGIAKIQGQRSETQAGLIKGTYGYMAPEQVRGELLTPAADVYAATIVLWELLARRKAIQRGALPEIEVLRAMSEPQIASLDVLRYDLPAKLRAAIRRGLEPKPELRTMTASEMMQTLRTCANLEEGRAALADAMARVREADEAEQTETRDAPLKASAADRVRSPAPGRVVSVPRAPGGDTLVGATDPRLTDDDVVALAKAVVNLGPIPTPPPPLSARVTPPIGTVAPTTRGIANAQVINAPRPTAVDPPPATTRTGSPFGDSVPPAQVDSTLRYGAQLPVPSSVPPPPLMPDGLAPSSEASPFSGRTESALANPASSTGARPPQGSLIFSLGMDMPQVPLADVFASHADERGVLGDSSSDEKTSDDAVPAAAVQRANAWGDAARTVSDQPPPFMLPSIPAAAPALHSPPPLDMPAPALSHLAGSVPRAVPVVATQPRLVPPAAPSPGIGWRIAFVAGGLVILVAAGVGSLLLVRAKRNALVAESQASAATSTATASARPLAPKPVISAPARVDVVPPASASPIASASSAASTPVATASASPTPSAAPVASAEHAPSTSSAGGSGTDLTLAGFGGHHRVFFDGHVVGETPGPIHVACGMHAIKVGSGGKEQKADLPCGDSFTLSSK